MTITIIIPVYNGAKYLNDCLISCVEQSYSDIEILLINDGSTDESEEIIISYEKKDTRIRHINQSNQGLVKSRQIGVSNAHTDFILFLDADDKLELDAVERLVTEQRRSHCDIVFANFITEYPNGRLMAYSHNDFQSNYESSNVLKNILMKRIAPTIWGKLISKSLFMQTEVPEYITIGEDAIAISQLLSFNPKISAIESYIYHYIQREGSMVNINNQAKNMKRLIFMDYFKRLNFNHLADKNDYINHYLKHFLIGEVFDVLRDGGSFKDVEDTYRWLTECDSLMVYKRTIGLQRIGLIQAFVISESFGRVVSKGYNIIRFFRNRLKNCN